MIRKYIRITGIPFHATEDDVINFIESLGYTVVSVHIVQPGVALMELGSEDEVIKLLSIKKMNWDNRKITFKQWSPPPGKTVSILLDGD